MPPETPLFTGREALLVGLRAMGDLAAAEPLYGAALAGAELVLGPDHPDTVIYRGNLERMTG